MLFCGLGLPLRLASVLLAYFYAIGGDLEVRHNCVSFKSRRHSLWNETDSLCTELSKYQWGAAAKH